LDKQRPIPPTTPQARRPKHTAQARRPKHTAQAGRARRTGRLAFALVLLAAVVWAPGRTLADQPSAPSLVGYWTLERNQGVVQIYSCGWRMLCGALVGLELDHPTDPMPTTWNRQSQCDYVFIINLRPRPNAWVGRITDPEDGHTYDARLSLTAPGVLKLRGYFLIPTLGETQTWTRFPGIPPAGCRMSPRDFSRSSG
jgi:uncharacterized protein (DUF2147 family)